MPKSDDSEPENKKRERDQPEADARYRYPPKFYGIEATPGLDESSEAADE